MLGSKTSISPVAGGAPGLAVEIRAILCLSGWTWGCELCMFSLISWTTLICTGWVGCPGFAPGGHAFLCGHVNFFIVHVN